MNTVYLNNIEYQFSSAQKVSFVWIRTTAEQERSREFSNYSNATANECGEILTHCLSYESLSTMLNEITRCLMRSFVYITDTSLYSQNS